MLSYYVMLLLSGTLTLFTDADRLVITQGDHHTARTGNALTLSCRLENTGDGAEVKKEIPKWKLYKGRTIESTEGRLYVSVADDRSASLNFKSTEESDAGTYTCFVNKSRYMKTDVQLRLADENEETLNISHEIESNAYLSCANVQHSSGVIVIWFFNNKRIDKNYLNGHYEFKRDDLIVKNISLADKGSYRCEVRKNKKNIAVKSINMQVVLSPSIKPMPKIINVISQHPVTLFCDAVGYPKPSYTWSKEKRLSDFLKLRVPIAGGNRSTLTIDKMDQSYEGKYYCNVKNMLGTAVQSSQLMMQIKPKVDDMKRKLTKEGKSVLLKCTTFGIPMPKLSWYRNNSRITSIDKTSRIYIIDHTASESRLFLDDVRRSDAGSYTCMAKSVAGIDRKHSKLVVEYKPMVNITTDNVVSWSGQKPILRCVADALPAELASLRWSRGNVLIENTANFLVTTRFAGRLLISTLQVNLKDDTTYLYGRYSCSMSNSMGVGKDTIHIIQDNVPELLSNLQVDKETANSVTLNVDISKVNIKVTGFRVKIMKIGGDEEKKTMYFETVSPMIVDDLRPATSYIIMVSARNHAGYGKETKFKVKTLSDDLTDYQSDMPAPKKSRENRDGRARVGVSNPIEGGGPAKVGDLLYGFQKKRVAILLGGAMGVALVVSLVAVVCRSRTAARKRRQDDYTNSVRCVLGDDMEVMRDLERTTAVDDDLPTATPRTRAKLMHENYSTSPRTLRNPTSRPEADGSATTSRSCGGGGGGAYAETTPTDARWAYSTFDRRTTPCVVDGMHCAGSRQPSLQHRSVSAESLPPPPPPHEHLPDQPSYHDVLDGYHSGDNLT